MNFDTEEFTTDRSMVKLQPGWVVGPLEGRNWIVELSTPSRARLLPLTGEAVEVELPGGRKFSGTKYARAISISQTVSREMVLERNDPEVLKEFLNAKKGPRVEGSEGSVNQNANENQNKNMSTKLAPARGGLAAQAIAAKTGAAAKPKKTAKPDDGNRGKLGNVYGNSITSFIRLLGLKGFTPGQALKALKAQGIIPAEATVKIQLGRGRQIKDELKTAEGEKKTELQGQLATLTKEQLATVTKDAGEPEAPKAKAADKKTTKPKAKKAAKTEPTPAPAATGTEPTPAPVNETAAQ